MTAPRSGRPERPRARRRAALGSATLITALALVLTPLTTGAAWAAKPTKPGDGGGGTTSEAEYAAIGDSFAAGTGGRSYLDTSCYRSANSYPKLLDAEATLRLSAFAACSGASTVQVLGSQIAQIPAGAKVVTVTVGGNDVGFGTVMRNCFVLVSSTCAADIAAGGAIARSPGFAASIQAVVDAVQARVPGAKVIVTGYPKLFHLRADGTNAKYVWADEVNVETTVLNDIIEANAVAAGAVFVDVEAAFEGRGIGSATPWINDFSIFRSADAFHPNATGYAQGYAVALRPVAVPPVG